MTRVSTTTLFAAAPHRNSGGIVGINRAGQVLIMSVNPDSIVPYVRQN